MHRKSVWKLIVSAFLVFLPLHVLAAVPWPGESWVASVDMTGLNQADWASNLSGGCWDPALRRLWVCTNGPATFWSLREDGSGSFLVEHEYDGTGDMEGITLVSTAPGQVFTLDEQARKIRAYNTADGALVSSWFLDVIPDWGNSGPEGLAFIPDNWLARSGFTDGNGDAYPQSVHGASGFAGIMLVAVQNSGWVYAVDLKSDGTYSFVGRYLTSRSESCELTFDASIGRLYILHNTAGNYLEVSDLTSAAAGPDRALTSLGEIQVPSGSNIEGFALTPALTPSHAIGDAWCFFTDDSNADGALRWFRQLPSTLTKVDGDHQQAVMDTSVAISPAVRVHDAFGNPLPDFSISFVVEAGGGTVTDGEAFTDQTGTASVGSWTLGSEPGENALSASGAGLSGSPQQFSATATPKLPVSDLPVLLPALLAIMGCGVRIIRRREGPASAGLTSR